MCTSMEVDDESQVSGLQDIALSVYMCGARQRCLDLFLPPHKHRGLASGGLQMEIKFLLIMHVKSVIPASVPKTYTKELMGEPIESWAPMTIRSDLA